VKNANTATIVCDHGDPEWTSNRLRQILEFLGIPYRIFRSVSQFADSVSGPLADPPSAVIGSLSAIGDMLFGEHASFGQTMAQKVHSFFASLPDDSARCAEILKSCTGDQGLSFGCTKRDKVRVKVSSQCPELTGPMDGVESVITARPSDRILRTERPDAISTILEADGEAAFFSINKPGLRLFVSCSSETPDLKEPLKGPWYDVKNHFLSAVPLLMYLKWAFRGVCWEANETGACLIIDDPILRPQYGFCNFSELEAQMREHKFSISVGFIPWNWRRTSPEMARLILKSEGRLSISVHGCDHTGAEFGSTRLSTLNSKTALARLRMDSHEASTGIPYDPVMIFPQGVFSRECLGVLQQHRFLAAVNTEVLPINPEENTVTIGDMWSLAITRYGSLPLFVRRYPSHGIENFAFDLLLGKPCLIVQHHSFFKENSQQALKFVGALNSLNGWLSWRGLGDVLKRSYHSRTRPDGVIDVAMFANKLLLTNESSQNRLYEIRKADQGAVPVQTVLANGAPVEWKRDNGSIVFMCEAQPSAQVTIHVQYRQAAATDASDSFNVKIAGRRYLSEFRDNFLSRHESLLQLAQKTKGFLAHAKHSS